MSGLFQGLYVVLVCLGYLAIAFLCWLVCIVVYQICRAVFLVAVVVYRLKAGHYYCRHCGLPLKWNRLEDHGACVAVPRCHQCGRVFSPDRIRCRWCSAELKEVKVKFFLPANCGLMEDKHRFRMMFPATFDRIEKHWWDNK